MYFVNPQLSGPIAQALISGMQLSYGQYDRFVNYLYNADLETLSDQDLSYLGIVVGCPWPFTSSPGSGYNFFTFSSSISFPEIADTGFSDIGETYGGHMIWSTQPYQNLAPRNYYESSLTSFTKMKRNGFSLYQLDIFCNSLFSGYSFVWDGPNIKVELVGTPDNNSFVTAQYTMDLLTQDPAVVFTYV